MALIKIPKEMGSTPGIVDNSNATAITIDSSEKATFAGAISVTGQTIISSDALVSTPSTYYDDIVVQNSASGTGAGMTVLVNATNGFGGLKFGDSTNSNQFGIGFDANANAGFLDVLGAQALTIDSNRNVGIGTSSPSKTLTVGDTDATSWITSGGSNVHLTMSPNGSAGAFIVRTGGTNGDPSTTTERMRIDSAGRVTMPYQPAFQAVPASTQSNISIGNTTILFGTERFDVGGNFAGSAFVAPVTGKYQLSVNIYTLSVDSGSAYLQFRLITSNRIYYYIFSTNALSQDAAYMSFPFSVLADMDAADTAYVDVQISGGTAQMDIDPVSTFSGYLVA